MTTELREWINGVEVVSHLYHAHAARCVEAWWHAQEYAMRTRPARRWQSDRPCARDRRRVTVAASRGASCA
jgi:hypothetical protein